MYAEGLPIRVAGLPTEPVYVGQQVRFPVVLLFEERPKSAPRFEVPEAEGGILLQLPDSPLYGTERVGGKNYTSWRYDFVYYPHRAGKHTIPPITGKARIGGQLVSGQTETSTVEAILPRGAKGLATLVSTTNFEVTESWRPEPG